ncbi:MAG: RraA family protein [Fastidiosipilaceae bacterium]|jgi:4-hydroxy-4-methyl-2-oxoglutarate aldolase|nr:RraA family protein [Clostridiaceae bacterium]
MSITNDIVNYIKKNRVSTTEVADCLGKSGVLENAHPVNRGHFCVGPVRWIYGYNESNWSIHEQARDIQEGEVVVLEAFDCKGRATIGELVTKFILLYRGAVAIASNAPLRDGNDLIKQNYPVWCSNLTPVGSFNRKLDEPLDPEIEKRQRAKYDGAIAVCDDTGVVIIPPEQVNEEFLEKLKAIELQEDIWFDCLDRRKWDTFDIVCLKRYREED